MAWIAPTIAAVAALGSAAINSSRSNGQAIQQSGVNQQALNDAQNNYRNQQMIQALINQRSIAGQVDSQGTSLEYDPVLNQWVSKLGKLPEKVQTTADQASISRNTTDLKQAQFANQEAAVRASRAAPYADASRRELESFKPMPQDQLIGLLQQQATNASNATFRPLVQDTLRSFARTGTSAGPVLGQIGKDAASNLRDSLIDAQIKGMTGTDQINQSKRSGLQSAAQTGAALATPAFGYSSVNSSPYSTAMQSLLGQRATGAATAPAYGAGATNTANKQEQDAYGAYAKGIPDPNYGIEQMRSGLSSVNTAFGAGGAGKSLIDALTKNNSTNAGDTLGQVNALGAGGANPAALAKIYGEDLNQGFMYP